MLVDYPLEWNKYMIRGGNCTFSKSTPAEIVEKAKKINEELMRYSGKQLFHFEGENED